MLDIKVDGQIQTTYLQFGSCFCSSQLLDPSKESEDSTFDVNINNIDIQTYLLRL